MSEISIEKAQKDLLECALFLANTVTSSELRAVAMKPVVERVIEKNNVDLAAELADSLDDPFERNKLLTRVISRCVEIEDDDYAFQLVQAIDDVGTQSQALELISLQTANRGDIAKALKIAENMEHSSGAFAGISVIEARQGLFSEALKTADKIDFPSSKVRALISIAGELIAKKQIELSVESLEKALIEAEKIAFTEEKIRDLIEIGEFFIQTGKNERAIEVFGKTREIVEELDGVSREGFFVNIAVGMLKAGDIDLADQTLDLVPDRDQIANCLVAFSQEFQEAGDLDEALESLEEGYAIFKSQAEMEIRDSKERYRILSGIAIQFAQLGKFERSIEVAQENPDFIQQNGALSQIAQLASLKEKPNYREQAILAINEEPQRLNTLVLLSDQKFSLEKKEEALAFLNEAAELIDSVEQLISRTEFENLLANRFFLLDQPEKAREFASKSLETIEKIRGLSNRAVALAELSRVYSNNKFEISEEDREILKKIVLQTQI